MKFKHVKASRHGACQAAIQATGAQSPAGYDAITKFLEYAVVDPDKSAAQWDDEGTAVVLHVYAEYLEWQKRDLDQREDLLGNSPREDGQDLSSSSASSSASPTPAS